MPNEISSLAPETVHRTVLSNGLTVLVREDRSAPVVTVVTYVKTGYFDETDDVVGIAHVLEHMFFKGTPNRGVGEIAKQTKASGGYLNAATIYDHTSYYAVLPSSGFDAGLEIQADAFANSVIDAGELARELEVIIEEAKRKEDNPGAVTIETLYELLHDRHRIRRWRIGRERELRALTRGDLVGFYRNFYRPGNTVLVVAGDVHVDTLMPRLESLYGHLPNDAIDRFPGEREAGRPGRRYRERAGDIAQTQMALGWRTPGTRHDATPRLDLAAQVLAAGRASRLYRAVREKQLASHVSAYNYTPTELGVFVVHAEGEPERAHDAARAMWSELRALRESGVTASELHRAQRLFESRWLRRLETMEGQANFLAEWEALGDWRLADEYASRMMSATADEVTGAVREYLVPGDASLMVYRPETAIPFALGAEDAFALLDAAPVTTVQGIDLPAAPPAPALVTEPVPEREHGLVSVFRTLHGVPILVRRKVGSPVVHFGLYSLGGGSLETGEDAGIATLMARTAIKGTERRSSEALAVESELLGGSISASVSSDGLGWTFSVPTPHLAAAVDLLADVVLAPTFPDEMLEIERTIAISQLSQLRDDMYRYPVRLAMEGAFGDHPYGRGVMGNETTLRTISADSVRLWHARHVRCAPAVLAVVGDVDPREVAVLFATAFEGLRYDPPVPPVAAEWPLVTRQRVETRDKAQTALALAFPGPTRGDPSRTDAHLIAGVASGLGGRFFDELRDKQSLAYTVHASSNERVAGGMFLAYIATSPEKEDVARAGLLREFARLRESPVSDEELNRARTYALGTHAISQQSGGNVLAELVDAWLYGEGLEELDDFEHRLRRVSAASMQDVARRYFDETRIVEGIVRGEGRRIATPEVRAAS
jgi:zinc protease